MISSEKRKKTNYFIIILLLLTVCFFCVRLFFAEKKVFFVFNHSFLILSSSSMHPAYPVDSLIIIKKSPFSNLKEGDAIVYKADALGGGLAFHRITRITENGVFTKGDANLNEDNQLITQSAYVGKIAAHSHCIGVYISRIRTPLGFVLFFIFPVGIVYILCVCVKRLWLLRA